MPQSSYSDKDLKRFQRQPLGISGSENYDDPDAVVEPSDELYSGRDEADDALAAAHAALTSADRFGRENQTSPLRSIEGRLASLSAERPNVGLSAITRPLRTAGEGLMWGALPAAGLGPGASGAMYGAGALLSAPDVARRLIDPEADESRWGAAGEGALLAAPQILGGLKRGAGLINEAVGPASRRAASDAAARVAEGASRAGETAQTRMLGRQLDSTGYSPEAVQKITGLHPKAPRSISTSTPISHGDEISGIMEGNQGAYNRPASVEGLMDALKTDSRVSGLAPEAEVFETGANTADPIAAYASGPRINKGLGDPSQWTPEQRSLYDRFVLGKGAPRENLNASIKQSNGPSIELLDEVGPNASGESDASVEALSRMSGMKSGGKQFVVYDRAGKMRKLIGPEAVDYKVRPGERYGVQGPNGFELLDQGR